MKWESFFIEASLEHYNYNLVPSFQHSYPSCFARIHLHATFAERSLYFLREGLLSYLLPDIISLIFEYVDDKCGCMMGSQVLPINHKNDQEILQAYCSHSQRYSLRNFNPRAGFLNLIGCPQFVKWNLACYKVLLFYIYEHYGLDSFMSALYNSFAKFTEEFYLTLLAIFNMIAEKEFSSTILTRCIAGPLSCPCYEHNDEMWVRHLKDEHAFSVAFATSSEARLLAEEKYQTDFMDTYVMNTYAPCIPISTTCTDVNLLYAQKCYQKKGYVFEQLPAWEPLFDKDRIISADGFFAHNCGGKELELYKKFSCTYFQQTFCGLRKVAPRKQTQKNIKRRKTQSKRRKITK